MVAVSITFPVASTTATLTPVRIPGSKPMVARGPAGAASSRSFRLRANTVIASVSARSRNADISSVSRCIESLMRHVQRTTSHNHLSAGRALFATLANPAIMSSTGLNGALHAGFSSSLSRRSTTVKIASFRPRNNASARCEGIVFSVSEYAK